MATERTRILVGIADAESEAVLDAAVAEARHRGVGVHLLHVVGPIRPASDRESLALVEETVRREGADLLEATARAVQRRAGTDVPVSTELVHGAPAATLVARSGRHDVVFLQRAARRHVPTLSVTNAVAARSHAAVVVVPPGGGAVAEGAPVVVGVEDPELSVEVVRAALDAARARGAAVRVVHAWSYNTGYDDIVFVGSARTEMEDRVRAVIGEALGDLMTEYPEVETEIVVRHGGEADVLVREARDAGLIVLGRHQSRLPFGAHLGSVVRAVLRAAPCPVMAVDPMPAAPSPEHAISLARRSETRSLVVAAVDGSADNDGVIRRAAHEARTVGGTLRLVHVLPDFVPISTMHPLWPDDLAERGRDILRTAEQLAGAAEPEVGVETRLAHGPRVPAIVDAAHDARLLVVGRDRSVAQRLFSGRTAAAVAGRASCPVETVSPDWADEAPRGVVVVGVRSAKDDGALLTDAAEVAADRGARLVVVHASRMPSGYEGVIESRVTADEWDRRCAEEMQPVLDEVRALFPAVPTELRIVHDRPAHALVAASEEADLVVVKRQHQRGPDTWRLGGTARAVLGGAHCSVRVVPPPIPVGSDTAAGAAQLADVPER